MPKLPGNLVQSPPFDNPLRRTSRPELSEPEATHEPTQGPGRTESGEPRSDGRQGGMVIPIASNVHASSVYADNRDPEPADVTKIHRITVRIEEPTRCALESECHRRRLAGEKTNVTEIARNILAQWASQTR
jgi:hypothetical protein